MEIRATEGPAQSAAGSAPLGVQIPDVRFAPNADGKRAKRLPHSQLSRSRRELWYRDRNGNSERARPRPLEYRSQETSGPPRSAGDSLVGPADSSSCCPRAILLPKNCLPVT